MLRVKSVVILKANPGILKCSGGIKMWIWLCVERGCYLGFENRVRMRKIERNIEAKKDAKRVVYMTMDQKAWKAVEKADSCCDRSCLGLLTTGLGRREMLSGLVILRMKVGP